MIHSHASMPLSETPAPPLFMALRALGVLVLVLMLVSIGYAGWIALQNWGAIQV